MNISFNEFLLNVSPIQPQVNSAENVFSCILEAQKALPSANIKC